MSVSGTSSRLVYTGNGATVAFPVFTDLLDTTHLRVYRRDNSVTPPTETLLVEGTLADYQCTGADPANGIVATAIQMNTAPTAQHKIIILRVLPESQSTTFATSGIFDVKSNEKQHDRAAMVAQQLQEELNRAPKLAKTSPTGPITIPEPQAGYFLRWNPTGTNLQNMSALGIPFDPTGLSAGQVPTYDAVSQTFKPGTPVSSGSSILVGTPTDTIYGVTGPIAGITPTDTLSDALDKVETVFAKLAPPKPANLSATTLALSTASYSALRASTGTTDLCVDQAVTTQPSAVASNFYDGDSGTLSGEVDTVVSGSRALTTADDSGTYSAVTINSDADPFFGVAGKAGFWKQLVATIRATVALSVGAHTYQLKHTVSGNSNLVSFYIDDPGTMTISGTSASSSGTSSFVSGVPGLATGQSVTVAWTVNNAVRTHYNATKIGSVTSSFTPTYNQALPGSPPANGAAQSFSQAMVIATAKYTENFQATVSGFNSAGASVTATVTPGTAIRLDTLSVETRNKSGQGQYPTKGSTAAQFGDPFDSTASIVAAGSEELQLLGGAYQYPPAVDYSTKYPAGPNYSTVPAGTFSNYRWATFDTGIGSSLSNMTLTLNGATNFGGSTIVAGLIVQTMVEGATGWLDANAAYPGVGSPAVNGDPAMVVASSSAAVKAVTFGATPRSGRVWVRVGIPSGSTKTFTGVTRS